jgi:hypothetical protein
MLFTTAQLPGAKRYLPRSEPGAGPTSKREAKLQAEVTLLTTQLLKLEREQALQFTRIAQIQQELDEIKNLLKKLAARGSIEAPPS